ncbi:MAG TPA: tetratricopeptide repeat protein [bacterium]|nr:tetratricopeptide repeat protein [bacterium]
MLKREDGRCEFRELLEQYVVGDLDPLQIPRVEEHLRTCEACRKEVEFIRAFAAGLRALESQGGGYHLSGEKLAQLASEPEHMDAAERAEAEEHIRCCSPCRETLKFLKSLDRRLEDEVQDLKQDYPASDVVGGCEPARQMRGWTPGWLRVLSHRPAVLVGVAAACVAIIAIGLHSAHVRLPGTGGPGGHAGARFAQVPAWQGLMEQAGQLAAAGKSDSANVLADRAVAAGLAQYAKSKKTVPVRLYRDGVGHTYYFPSVADAGKLYEAARSVKERAIGADSPEVAAVLMDLGSVYLQNRRTEDARASFERALAIRRQALPPGDPDIARSAGALAEAHFWMKDSAGAEALYRQSLEMLEKSLGPNHPDVAIALIGVGKSIGNQWRHAEAEPYYKQALEIRRVALSADDPDFSDALMRLGNLYKQLARYSEAEGLFAEAVAVRKKALDPTDQDIAQSLDHVAEICMRQGRYAEAEKPYAEALEIRKAGLGPNHPDVGASYHYLGNVCMALGRYNEAESYYRRGLRLREKLGQNHPDVATSLTDVAMVDERNLNFKEAEKLIRRALNIREKTLGESHPGVPNPGVAMSLEDLADLSVREGKYAEAELLYAKAISVWEQSMGPDHPAVASALEGVSRLYRLDGNGQLAIESAKRAATMRYENLAQNAESLTEEEALVYAQFMRQSVGNYLTCLLDAGAMRRTGQVTSRAQVGPASAGQVGQPQLAEAADLILRTKGQVFDEIFERQQRVVLSADPAIQSLAASVTSARSRLAGLLFEGASQDTTSYRVRVDSLRQRLAGMETELAQRSADVARAQVYKNISTSRVAADLPKGATLVEFVRFDYVPAVSDTTIPHYLAVALGSDDKPVIVDLGEAAKIDALVAQYQGHMNEIESAIEDGRMAAPTQASEDAYKPIAAALYVAVWRPIEPYTNPGGLVLVAPDGPLNRIAFAALSDETGKYVIEGRPIHYLASGRDLVRLEDHPKPGVGLLALGDPDYSAPVAMRLEKIGPPVGPTQGSRVQLAAITRNARSACAGELNLPPVESLSGTRDEIERVASAWAKYMLGPEAVYFGAGASEERFKADAPGKRVIHLATHGFFFGDSCRPPAGAGPEVVGENPLLLSGLLLAGANLRGAGSEAPGADDGILTAYEISSMNLEGTQMVVLSACGTGLGKAQAGEGVYGLRRAFEMAGARTVVSTLWDVPDGSVAGITTADLVAGLYTRKGEPLPEAIRQIQLGEIKRLRQKGLPDHPYSWAAFVATGDWR